jgi:hypothetical protein
VVVIITVIYAIFIFVPSQKEQMVDLSDLKHELKKYHHQNHMILQCDDCKKACSIVVDSNVSNTFDFPPLYELEEENFYRYDRTLRLAEIAKFSPAVYTERYEPVCFRFDMFSNGSSTEMIISTDEKTYLFDVFNDEPLIFESLSDVGDYFETLRQKVQE